MNQQSVELLRQLGRQESARLYDGGQILTFGEMQTQAREFASGDKEMEIAAFRCLEHVNDSETNRRTFDKNYRLFSSARYNREQERQRREEEASRAAKAGNLLQKANSALFSVKQQTKQQ